MIFLVFATQLKAQTKKYLEVRGNTDITGNILLFLPVLSKEQKKDSLINKEAIAACFKKSTEAINVINCLAQTGWYLQSTANISRDKEGRPNSEFILYYFVKEFNK